MQNKYFVTENNRFSIRWFSRTNRGQTFHRKTLKKGISRDEALRLYRYFQPDLNNMLWCRWCLEDVRNHGSRVSESTAYNLQNSLNNFSRIAAPIYLANVTYNDLIDFRNIRKAEGYAAASINTELRSLKGSFRRAVKRGILFLDPTIPPGNTVEEDRELLCKEDSKTVRIVPDNHFQILMDNCPSFDWELLLALGYYAGLRIGEILALKTYDINLKGKQLSVYNSAEHRTKSGKERHIVIAKPLLEMIQYKLSICQRVGHLVESISLKPSGNCSRRPSTATRSFKLICEKAGLVDDRQKALYTPHCLRKSAITCWAEYMEMPIVQAMAGHSDINTTMKYYVQVKNLVNAHVAMQQIDSLWN